MSILVLIGTKAQFIKTAPILREMDTRGMAYKLIYTGQHSETFDLLETAFGTRPPDEMLVPNFEAATHGRFLSWIFKYWREVLTRIRKGQWRDAHIGIVHGDTASTLFGAMAIRMAGGTVVHVEAGLRSPRLLEPFPEEIIRRLVSRLSRIHFAPDEQSARNLAGIRGQVVNTHGNTLKDALRLSLSRFPANESEGGHGGYAVVSMHRSENLSSRHIFDMLMQSVVETASLLPVRFVLHPATREKIATSGWLSELRKAKDLELMNRMDYPDFIRLLVGARFLMTDGGSNQEEAAMLGLPTLLLRRATERMDGIGDNIEFSDLAHDKILSFARTHSKSKWIIRQIDGNSPTSELVDTLQSMQNQIKKN